MHGSELELEISRTRGQTETLNHALYEISSHERIAFSCTSVFTGDLKVLNIHVGLYKNCSDFKILCRYLTDHQNSESRCNELMVLEKYLKYLQKYLQECLDRSTAESADG